MLNYIWGGLIVLSLVFALTSDVNDFARDTYRNDAPLPVTVTFEDEYSPTARRQRLRIEISDSDLIAHYGDSSMTGGTWEGILLQTSAGREIRFAEGVSLPEPLATICNETGQGDCRGALQGTPTGPEWRSAVTFAPVRWVKMNAIAAAALSFAETAVTLALGLIGGLGLWMGLLKIAEASGMLHALVRVTQPLIRPLFPQVPKDHPALGMIVLNLSANMLGMGNAATPLGIKAMQELQTLNKTEDTATDPMVMLLTMNTASVQIMPPVTLVAIMGLQINQLFFSILITTGLSLVVGITAVKLLGRLKRYREVSP
ncbi:MAG: nucleoside recognition protein [Rhodothermaceae bacterium]|nr:nucleoside recognition protein [Rhodothermaceae bacterium]MXX57998.1 nucleoside recognition protein [Rhodothermaceae bacterium]MYD19841.1 nucleoside recognition protein [Rhodothermaceae bacterium]MYD57471.1 nucleoside recognition protein [Rhodothermaceae bacterium]MYI44369.1 nucleoside recognition protein [Rhodothermaceae bacterium]